ERVYGQKGASAIHSEHNLPESNSNVKREMGILGGPLQQRIVLTAAFPSPTPLFSNGLKSRKQWAGHGGKESRTKVKVGDLPITGLICQRYPQITIIGTIVSNDAIDDDANEFGSRLSNNEVHRFRRRGCAVWPAEHDRAAVLELGLSTGDTMKPRRQAFPPVIPQQQCGRRIPQSSYREQALQIGDN
ncbi:MAG TPA: hypothetical protein VIT23_04790, partial [Terrimicrobiaceae bacterium]